VQRDVPQTLPHGFSADDFTTIRMLRDEGILVEIEPGQFKAKTGTVPVFCSDGDRFLDVFSHHTKTCAEGNYPIRPHVIAYPGAPILLSRQSPRFLGIPIDRVLIHGIRTGPQLKEIRTVVLVHHWPCAMAKQLNIDLIRSIELVFNGKQRLKRELAGSIHEAVACLQVDYGANESGENDMKTYHIQKEKWLRWITTRKHGEKYPISLYLNSMPL